MWQWPELAPLLDRPAALLLQTAPSATTAPAEGTADAAPAQQPPDRLAGGHGRQLTATRTSTTGVHAKEKFDEDVEEGLMLKMTLREFVVERYGDDRAIAALAVIVEDEAANKKRIMHDATHGGKKSRSSRKTPSPIRVNHRIKCRDKLRAPGAREKKQLLREMISSQKVPFLWLVILLKPTDATSARARSTASLAARSVSTRRFPEIPLHRQCSSMGVAAG